MATQIYTSSRAKEHHETARREALRLLDERLPAITIGPRVEADIRRRVRELESRHSRAMTMKDRRELAALRDLLQLSRREMDQ